MSDFVTAPVPHRPWYKRTWGIVLIIMSSIALFFILWFAWEVYTNVRLMKSGALRPITEFNTDFTKGTFEGSSVVDGIELVPETSPTRGKEDATITIVQFGDFQCPYSGREFPIIRPIMESATNVRFVYRDFPLLDIHPEAMQAAIASHCAQDQDKYWAYHDQLFLNQNDLSETALYKYATAVGLDEPAFRECLSTQRHKDRVMKDLQDGIALGVRGTPTFFVNGVKLEGAIPKSAWDAILERLKHF